MLVRSEPVVENRADGDQSHTDFKSMNQAAERQRQQVEIAKIDVSIDQVIRVGYGCDAKDDRHIKGEGAVGFA